MTIFTPPLGLGIGVNSEKLPDPAASWHLAVNRLRPAWTHSWGRLIVAPNYMPSIFPESSGIVPASSLLSWASRMVSAGYNPHGLSWQICNEPWGYYQVSPNDLVDLIAAQSREFDRARLDAAFVVINENVNGSNFDRTVAYYQRIRQRRIHARLGVHFWEKGQHLRDTIENFFAWWAGYGDWSTAMPIIITECGPGLRESMNTWLETMPTMYAMLDRRHPESGKKMVAALAPFSAYPKLEGTLERHPGFMLPDGTLTPLGEQYLTIRNSA